MGNLFAAGQPISEILQADVRTLKYFSDWYKVCQREWTNAANEARKLYGPGG